METLALPGGHWLEVRAAWSLMRCWLAGCPEPITDAGRTWAEQQALRDKYEAGTGNFAWPPDDPRANHVGGMAVDLPWGGRTWMRNSGAGHVNGAPTYNEWGWSGVPNEAWHFNYNPKHDKHLEDDMYGAEDRALAKEIRAAQSTMNARQIIMLEEQRAQGGNTVDAKSVASQVVSAMKSPLAEIVASVLAAQNINIDTAAIADDVVSQLGKRLA